MDASFFKYCLILFKYLFWSLLHYYYQHRPCRREAHLYCTLLIEPFQGRTGFNGFFINGILSKIKHQCLRQRSLIKH